MSVTRVRAIAVSLCVLALCPLSVRPVAGSSRSTLSAQSREPDGSAAPFYQNDFESAVGPEWSIRKRTAAPSGLRGSFLGDFGNDVERLGLTNLPAHDEVFLTFRLYAIRSWDGSNAGCCGPDVWDLSIENGATLVHTTFSNGDGFNRVDDTQSFPGAFPASTNLPRTGASETDVLGFELVRGQVMDAVYNMRLTFPHTSSSLALLFSASNLQFLGDESWGIDDVTVAVGTAVASPVITGVSPSTICPSNAPGGGSDSATIEILGEGFTTEISSLFFSPRPDGSQPTVVPVSFSVESGTRILCEVPVASLTPFRPYFPFVTTAAGVISPGFGLARHPRGLDAFLTASSATIQLDPVTQVTAPGRPAIGPSCGASAVSERGAPGIAGYNVYVSNRPGVRVSPSTFYARLSQDETSFGASPFTYYVVTAVGSDGSESGPSPELAAIPATVSSVDLTLERLTVKGDGFSNPTAVFIDGIGFTTSPRVRGTTKIVQSGLLENGQRAFDYANARPSVTIAIRTGSGLITNFVYRHQ